MNEFLTILAQIKDESTLVDFCRKRTLHGTPFIFNGKEDLYYDFRKRIADKFNVAFHEIFITGSAKLGFSPHKNKNFDLNSDIDVAIVSSSLFDRIMSSIHDYQMELRENRKAVTEKEIANYHKFLEYGAIGWMRPDLLPESFRIKQLKDEWFKFFSSISYGNSEVGDYKIAAGAFKSYSHLEKYTLCGLRSLRTKLQVGVIHANTN